MLVYIFIDDDDCTRIECEKRLNRLQICSLFGSDLISVGLVID